MLISSIRHILALINKVVTVQISRLYLVSTSTPGLSLILSLCFETDGYYYNKKKVANYFSSRQRKQLTTGIMCWLKSNPVSMKDKKKPQLFFFFYSVAWRLSTPQSMLTLTWSQLLFTYRRTEIWFVELIHHHWCNCSMRSLPYERSCLSCHFIKNIVFLLKTVVKLRLTFPHKFKLPFFFLIVFTLLSRFKSLISPQLK